MLAIVLAITLAIALALNEAKKYKYIFRPAQPLDLMNLLA